MKILIFVFVIAIAASAQTNSNVQTFGMVGIAAGQTARLNVLNVGGQGQTEQCLVSLLFLDDQGALIKTRTLAPQPGQSVFADLADTELGLGPNERREIRAVVAKVPAQETAPNCVLASTVEIFDHTTGKTAVLMAKTMPIPQSLTAADRRSH